MNTSKPPNRTGASSGSTTPQSGGSFSVPVGHSGAQMPGGRGTGDRPSGKNKLLNKVTKVTSWLATSEPSAQALKQHKKDSFAKAGIPLDDPNGEASIKLHAPIGEIPADAIRPASSLSPEEVAKKKAAERQRRKMETRGGDSRTSQSSSGMSTASPSALNPKPSFAWDDLPFDGTNRGGTSGVFRG
ncbi:hypothetical protein QBC34DRAFT_91417 [Podospora aff. communis PSN243]|uniref:Uncharacterized protein n=1 Tax=Podospora aff. communis PSN243 TaxID=3040156 RepID=A0AAV9GNC1_9PEZI|nr:hypothetical protein QBC34DRAFT_91417 [Podospora aff. communis PSN243]